MLKGFQKKGDPVDIAVRCKHIPEFKGLEEGQEITVRGKCLPHKDTILAAELVDCQLIKGPALK